jgi:ribosomal protein S18 acetylase RimI-like enzyme
MSWFEDFNPVKGENTGLPDGFIVRNAVPSDAEGIALLRQEREEREYSRLIKESTELMNEMIEVETTGVFIAEISGTMIGFSILRYFIPGEDAPINTAPEGWYLLGIYVKKDYRRRGVGSELIRARLRSIPEHFDCAYFFTNPKNLTSQLFHERFGFKRIEEDIVYPNRKFTTVYYKGDLIEMRKRKFSLLSV